MFTASVPLAGLFCGYPAGWENIQQFAQNVAENLG